MADEKQDIKPGERTFTQSEFDAAFNERMKSERKKHAAELEKYSDYDDLKAKAAKLDEIEAASKSQLEKAVEAMNAATKRAEDAESKVSAIEAKAARDALAASVASEFGVPASHISGNDEDELRASAKSLREYVDAQKPHVPETKAMRAGQVCPQLLRYTPPYSAPWHCSAGRFSFL